MGLYRSIDSQQSLSVAWWLAAEQVQWLVSIVVSLSLHNVGPKNGNISWCVAGAAAAATGCAT